MFGKRKTDQKTRQKEGENSNKGLKLSKALPIVEN